MSYRKEKYEQDRIRIERHLVKYHNLDHHSKIEAIANEVASKTEGLAFLMSWFQQEGGGNRDHEAFYGISLIMEEIAEQGRLVARMLDTVTYSQGKEEDQERTKKSS